LSLRANSYFQGILDDVRSLFEPVDLGHCSLKLARRPPIRIVLKYGADG
jgi:hypothetical protein